MADSGNDGGTANQPLNFLKPIFDHFRNMFICGGLLFVGLSVLNGESFLGKFGEIVGVAVILVSGVLAVLNSAAVVFFVKDALKPVKFRGRQRGVLIGPVVLIVYFGIVAAVIGVTLESKM